MLTHWSYVFLALTNSNYDILQTVCIIPGISCQRPIGLVKIPCYILFASYICKWIHMHFYYCMLKTGKCKATFNSIKSTDALQQLSFAIFTQGLRLLPLLASFCLCVHESTWACPHNNLSPIQAITKFGTEVQITLIKIPIVLGTSKSNYVHVIRHHWIKLEPPNSDKRCRTSMLFWEVFDLDLQGQIELKSPNFIEPCFWHFSYIDCFMVLTVSRSPSSVHTSL